VKSPSIFFSFDAGPEEIEVHSSVGSGTGWLSPEVREAIDAEYLELRLLASQCCFLRRGLDMTELVVGSTPLEALRSHPTRWYLYERFEDAWLALKCWDGRLHPGGPWIICRGVESGKEFQITNNNFVFAEMMRSARFRNCYPH